MVMSQEKPEVNIENYKEVYAFYRKHKQNRWLARAAYALLDLKLRPQVAYDEGAEEELYELMGGQHRPAVLVIKHLSEMDATIIAAAAHAAKPLRQGIGRTRVLAKDELFQDPKMRKKIELMGSIPVFRSADHLQHGGRELLLASTNAMLATAAFRLAGGDNLATYAEGTIHAEPPYDHVHPIGSGVGRIIQQARELGADPFILPVGLSLGPDNNQYVRSSVYIGAPEANLPEKPGAITRIAKDRLQRATTLAAERVVSRK